MRLIPGLLLCSFIVVTACTPPPPRPDGGSTGGGAGGSSGAGGGAGKVCLDNDGDGVGGTGDCSGLAAVDCDDGDATVSPTQPEVCDGKDNDCDQQSDEGLAVTDWFVDQDGDTFGSGLSQKSCAPVAGRVDKGGDCDDADKLVFPGQLEACNQKDDNCNNQVDESVVTKAFYTDGDGDTFGAGAATMSCLATLPGKVLNNSDCDDTNPAIKPGAAEVCNGKDDNCVNGVDETFPNKNMACTTALPGVCTPGTTQCVTGVERCVSTTQASTELCDNLDNDCDGMTDETFPTKGATCNSGLGVCSRPGTNVCNAAKTGVVCNATPGPTTAPACDSMDNDCDGTVDELELAAHADTAATINPTSIDVAPYFFTAASCNGGAAGSGTDAFVSYMAAYVNGGSLYAQAVREDGVPLAAPVSLYSGFTAYGEVAIGQAGSGMLVAGVYQGATDYLDLYYVGAGGSARTLNGSAYFNLASTSTGFFRNVRIVRGNGGRVIVLWREDNGTTSKIRWARLTLSGSGTAYTVTQTNLPADLVATAGMNGNFGAASSHEEYGDTIGCPTGLGRFAVAYRFNDLLRLDVWNEDGTSAGFTWTLYSGAASYSPKNPDVAWINAGGDRWGAAWSNAYTTTNDSGLFFWWSSGSFQNVGGYFSGSGQTSVSEPRIAARPTEFLVSALVAGTATAANEPQIRLAKYSSTGASLVPLTQGTVAANCTGANCVNGPKKLPRALGSASGPNKTAGAVMYGSSANKVTTSVIGCN